MGHIRKCDISFTKMKGKNIMLVKMANRKNKNFKKKNIPIPIDKEPELVNIIWKYIKPMDDRTPLFPFEPRTAERILAKAGMNPHFLRDIRLTHMVTIYEYDTHQLVKFAGWQSIAPAERYIRLGVHNLIDKF